MKRLFCIVLTIYLALACTACSPVPNARKASEGLPHYAIEATYDANGTLSGHLEYTFVNDTDNVLDSREFLLYGVAFRKDAHTTPIEPRAFYCGESYGDMHVDRVTVNGTETETSLRGDDGEILCVRPCAVSRIGRNDRHGFFPLARPRQSPSRNYRTLR